MDKIIVPFEDIRGLGDIVSPKALSDFERYRSKITAESSVDGTIFTLSYQKSTSCTLTVDKNRVDYTETVHVNGVLLDENDDPIVGARVKVYTYNGVYVESTTNTDGTFSSTWRFNESAIGYFYEYWAVFEGDETHDAVTSNRVMVTVTKINTVLTLSLNKHLIIKDDVVTVSGLLKDSHNNALPNAPLTLQYGGSSVSIDTDSQGKFNIGMRISTVGIITYVLTYAGTSTYQSATSEEVLVEVVDEALRLGITGDSFSTGSSTTPFVYTGNVLIDWGDNSALETYNGGQLNHNYGSSGSYTIKIFGNITGLKNFYNEDLNSVAIGSSVTSLGFYCFNGCTGLTSITLPNTLASLGEGCFRTCISLTSISIPSSVTIIGADCFKTCSGLSEIVLEWDSASEIVSYVSSWISGASSFDHFLIPEGTKALYEAKSYPSNLLKEVGEVEPDSIDFTLTAGKQILSYADVSGGNEYATLTATVYDEDDNPLEGVDVNLYNGSTLWDTLTTGSDGTVSKTYTSQGSGDIVFTAEVDGTLLTKTYSVQDCSDYQAMTSNAKQSRWNIPSAVSSSSIFGYSDNGWKFGNTSSYQRIIHKININAPFIVEFTLTELSSNGLLHYIYSNGTTPNAGVEINTSNGKLTICGTQYNYTFSANDKFRIEWDTGTCKVYKNDVLFGQGTHSVTFPTNVEFHTGSSRYCRIKDFKIKPL